MTTNIDLWRIAKSLSIRLDHIMFKNELYKLSYKDDLSVVLNMSDQGHKGTHWISFKIKGNMLYYFDPFGVEPPEEVLAFAKKNNLHIIYNDIQVEDINGTNCGQLNMYFLSLL